MTKIILFNSPANSGKDVAVATLVEKRGTVPFSFKRSLKAITLSIYNVPEAVWDSWYTREGKEIPRKELYGLSCRQALIKVSEEIIKPNFSQRFFGEREKSTLKALVKEHGDIIACCSDCGFNQEIDPLLEEFGQENVYVVRIDRDGCSFVGDSRNWVDNNSVLDSNYITIFNNGTLQEFEDDVLSVYDYIVRG